MDIVPPIQCRKERMVLEKANDPLDMKTISRPCINFLSPQFLGFRRVLSLSNLHYAVEKCSPTRQDGVLLCVLRIRIASNPLDDVSTNAIQVKLASIG